MTGIIFGLACAAVWAFLGYKTVSRKPSTGNYAILGDIWNWVVRGTGGISLGLLTIGLVLAAGTSGNWAFFQDWALTCYSGIAAYFVLRYGFKVGPQ